MAPIPVLFWSSVALGLYVYIGYPLVLTLLAAFRPRHRPHGQETPRVTLLIAAFNEEAVIADKIENSLSLDYPEQCLQILVAADGSTDRTRKIVGTYTRRGVELSYSPVRKGKMAAINHAMLQACGDIVIFSDANNMFSANTLRALTDPFSDPGVGCTTGAKTIIRGDGALGDSEGIYWKYEDYIKKQESRIGCCTGVAGEIFAIRRKLIEACPEQIINDDFYLAMRTIRRGYRVIYVPEARSMERISLFAGDEIQRRARIVAGRYQAMAMGPRLLSLARPVVLWQVISHKFLRLLLPAAMIVAVAANLLAIAWPVRSTASPVLCLAFPMNWIMLCLQIFFYGLAFSGKYVHSHGVIGRLMYLPTFLVNSNMAALLGLLRYLSGNQTPLWEKTTRREAVGRDSKRP